MRRAFIIIAFVVLLASLIIGRGRVNVVRHYYKNGSHKAGSYKEFLASRGSCRHHLTAHPNDVVAKPWGWVNDPAACNW